MKRGLVLPLCALALAASGGVAMAQSTVTLSLNLRYTDPANPAEGGVWSLIAKTTNADGIAAISAYIDNITEAAASTAYGNGILNTNASGYAAGVAGNAATINAASIGAIVNGTNPFFGSFAGVSNIVYGQDTAVGPIVLDVGNNTGGFPNRIVNDPLGGANTTWDNAALIAQGTWTGTARPVFAPSGANSTDANVLPAGATTTVPQNTSLDANVTTTVRGDSLRGLMLEDAAGLEGLRLADFNRDFIVNGLDLAILAANFNGTNRGWDTGDSNNSGTVNGLDLADLAANFNQSSTPPTVGSIPEPASLGLAGLAICGLMAARRRRYIL